MPKVSVIIPTFNRKLLLKAAIESVLGQSLCDFELIIADDGSTDDTASMVRGIGSQRVRYFYKTNGGPSSARNLGLKNALGEYVAFLDSDDLWTPDYLGLMVKALEEKQDYGVAYTAMVQCCTDGKVVRNYRAKHCISGWVTAALWEKSFVPPPAAVMRRKVLANHFFDEHLALHEDGDFFLRLSLRTQFLYVPSSSVIRRVQNNSVSQMNGATKLDTDKVRVFERFYFRLGGDKWISKKRAYARLAKMYYRMGYKFYKRKFRNASIYLYRKSLGYNRFYVPSLAGLIKCLLISPAEDAHPDWKFPAPLPVDIVSERS